jgi:hypothetical protein
VRSARRRAASIGADTKTGGGNAVLVDSCKSVIVIEHHQAVMAQADWITDLGPGAGHDGCPGIGWWWTRSTRSHRRRELRYGFIRASPSARACSYEHGGRPG